MFENWKFRRWPEIPMAAPTLFWNSIGQSPRIDCKLMVRAGGTSLMGCDGFKSRLVGWMLGICCLLGYQWYFSAVFGTTWTWWKVAATNHKRNQSNCWLTYWQIPSTFLECRSSENKCTISPQNCANGAPKKFLWFTMLSHQIAIAVVDTRIDAHVPDTWTTPHPHIPPRRI